MLRHRSLLAVLAVLSLCVLALGDPPPKVDPPKQQTFYKVGNGTHYHRENCPVCKRDGEFIGKPLTPAQAAALKPCSKCNPPPLATLAPAQAADPKPSDPAKPAEPSKQADPAKPANSPKATTPAKPAAAVTFFRVGKGTHYHLQSCPVCNPKGVFVGNALTMAEVAKAGLIPCTKCNPPGRKPTVTLGKVILIKDGDTFVLDDGKTKDDVRLEGIDAPEIKGKQAFSKEAMEALVGKLLAKEVKVEWLQRDRDERVLGHVYLAERWINLEMVAEGFAWHFTKFNADQRLADAEKAARAAGLGLWKDKNAISPDAFRAQKKAKE